MIIGQSIMAIAVAVFSYGCGEIETKTSAIEGAPVSVQVREVERVDMPVTVTAVGITRPDVRALPATRLMGRIVAVQVHLGDTVKKNQVLARVESRDLQAKRMQVKSALADAEAVLVNAEKNIQRMRNLRADEAIPQQKLDEATMAYTRALAAVGIARESILEVEDHLRYAVIRSPLEGVVVEKNIAVGDIAQPGAPLFAVEKQDPIKIVLAVSERDLGFIHVGQQVQAEIRALGMERPARVAAIVPAADPGSHTFRVEVVVANANGDIGSGMFARVRFDKASRSALVIPVSAAVERGQLRGAYAIVDGRAHLRWLRLGRAIDERVEVLSGLKKGDRVVVGVKGELRDGSKVEIRRHD